LTLTRLQVAYGDCRVSKWWGSRCCLSAVIKDNGRRRHFHFNESHVSEKSDKRTKIAFPQLREVQASIG